MSKQKAINVIARTNGVGLDSDAWLITQALEKAGHHVVFHHCRASVLKNKVLRRQPFAINIFLERIFPKWCSLAQKNLLIPNQERFPQRHVKRLKLMDYVLCKSKHAEEIFHALGCQVKHLGFSSKDRRVNNSTTQQYDSFFHLAGRSTLKGTEDILDLWNRHPEWPTLTLVQHVENAPESVPENVNLITDHLSNEELNALLNKHKLHLCPSRSEGWGHYIVEAMSVEAVALTTDAPPMNELLSNRTGILVPYLKKEPRHLGFNYHVNINDLEKAVSQLITMPEDQKVAVGNAARKWYEQNHEKFEIKINDIIKECLQ